MLTYKKGERTGWCLCFEYKPLPDFFLNVFQLSVGWFWITISTMLKLDFKAVRLLLKHQSQQW